MMVRKLLKAAIYIKVIVVTTLVTIHEPMADEVMDEFVTSEIMEEEPLAEDTELFEEETNEELNMIATNEEENLNDMIDDTDFLECDGEDGNSIQQFKPVCSDGWELDEAGYHYVLDENRMKNCIMWIDDGYYGFDEYGIMYSEEWIYTSSGVWYYATASGKLAVGDVMINGTCYHFDSNGIMKTGMIKTENGYTLYDLDGYQQGTINKEGWNLLNGNYYYIKDGEMLTDTDFQTSDGARYTFDSQGIMRKNEQFEGRWYSEGGWCMVGWIFKAGSWYYADPVTAQICTGFQVINGVQYYFDESDYTMLIGDKIVDGKLIIADENGSVTITTILAEGWSCYGGEYYYYVDGEPYSGWVGEYFVDNGCMQREKVIGVDGEKHFFVDGYGVRQKNRWVNGGSSYAKEDGTLAENEWLEIDGKKYYFEGINKDTGLVYQEGKAADLFGADGIYIGSSNDMKLGWNLINGEWYYKYGANLLNGKAEIDGKEYCFENGIMMKNTASTANLSEYCYGEDGIRLSGTGWKLLDGKWYYLNSKSEYITGWAMIGTERYYFLTEEDCFAEKKTDKINYGRLGVMCTGYRVINGRLCYFDQNGAYRGIRGCENGWYYAKEENDWYFMKGQRVTTGRTTVNGIEYIFASDGKMYADTIVKENGLRYVNSDGAIVTQKGWRLLSNGYIYIQDNGTVCTGIKMINGVIYYFGEDGIWIG